ncbi:hypothetical protein OROGR_021069 [Orobanche gracilis]
MASIKATGIRLITVALLIYAPASAEAYTNHTVGGVGGWFFNSPTSRTSADYSSWAANQTFNRGDYLIIKLIYAELKHMTENYLLPPGYTRKCQNRKNRKR